MSIKSDVKKLTDVLGESRRRADALLRKLDDDELLELKPAEIHSLRHELGWLTHELRIAIDPVDDTR